MTGKTPAPGRRPGGAHEMSAGDNRQPQQAAARSRACEREGQRTEVIMASTPWAAAAGVTAPAGNTGVTNDDNGTPQRGQEARNERRPGGRKRLETSVAGSQTRNGVAGAGTGPASGPGTTEWPSRAGSTDNRRGTGRLDRTQDGTLRTESPTSSAKSSSYDGEEGETMRIKGIMRPRVGASKRG